MTAEHDRPHRRRHGDTDPGAGLWLTCDRLGIGLWDCDPASGRFDANAVMGQLLGDPPGPSTRTLSALTDRVHPADVHRFAALIEPGNAQDPDRTESEFRLRQSDGRWLWVRGRLISADRDRWGRPTRLLGTIEDIDDRKRSEHRLAEREALLAAISDQLDVGILVVDAETLGFVQFNRAIRSLLGYTEAEFSRLRLHDIQALPAAEVEQNFRERADALRQAGALTLEQP